MAGDFAIPANHRSLLNFYEGADLTIVANPTTIQINKVVNLDILT
jgi:hypothetical protein